MKFLAFATLLGWADGLTIASVFPRRGSTDGGTFLVIEGSGFALPLEANPWDAQAVFVGAIPCDIKAHWTNSTRIVCVTRASGRQFSTSEYLPVTVQLFGGLGEASSWTLPGGFRYESLSTPSLHWASAWGGSAGELLSFHGVVRGVVQSADQLELRIGEALCAVDNEARPLRNWKSSARTVDCVLPESDLPLAGRYNVSVRVRALRPDTGE
jgi:hypothetical protein